MSRHIIRKNNFVYSETSEARKINKQIKNTKSLRKCIEVHGIFNGLQKNKQINK